MGWSSKLWGHVTLGEEDDLSATFGVTAHVLQQTLQCQQILFCKPEGRCDTHCCNTADCWASVPMDVADGGQRDSGVRELENPLDCSDVKTPEIGGKLTEHGQIREHWNCALPVQPRANNCWHLRRSDLPRAAQQNVCGILPLRFRSCKHTSANQGTRCAT